MEHPQPAFDLLTSLPIETRVEDCIFVDWYATEEIDAERGDDIADHPEVWERLELPDVLAGLSMDDFVGLQPVNGGVNLNAFAIGLGLEDITYKPEVFAGLVYNPEKYDATVLIFPNSVLLSLGDTADVVAGAIELTIDRIQEVGLDDDATFEADIQSKRVSDII